MSAATDDQLAAEVQRLAAELSQRAIAKRLGISRHRVGLLLAAPVAGRVAAGGRVADAVADRVAAGGPVADAVADHVADRPADDPAGGRPVRGAGIFVPLREGLGKDVADLMRTGCTAADAAAFAVAVLASAYRAAVQRGLLAEGVPFDVVDMTLLPMPAQPTTAGRP